MYSGGTLFGIQNVDQCHCIGTPEAGAICRYIPQALDNGFMNLFRLAISGVSSASEYSNIVFHTPLKLGVSVPPPRRWRPPYIAKQ
jgi:hypothetical protein